MQYTTEKPEPLPTTVICRYCLKEMQLAEDIEKNGEIIGRRFICNCQGTIYHYTWHKVGRKIG
jgi:hypothetical protein